MSKRILSTIVKYVPWPYTAQNILYCVSITNQIIIVLYSISHLVVGYTGWDWQLSYPLYEVGDVIKMLVSDNYYQLYKKVLNTLKMSEALNVRKPKTVEKNVLNLTPHS